MLWERHRDHPREAVGADDDRGVLRAEDDLARAQEINLRLTLVAWPAFHHRLQEKRVLIRGDLVAERQRLGADVGDDGLAHARSHIVAGKAPLRANSGEERRRLVVERAPPALRSADAAELERNPSLACKHAHAGLVRTAFIEARPRRLGTEFVRGSPRFPDPCCIFAPIPGGRARNCRRAADAARKAMFSSQFGRRGGEKLLTMRPIEGRCDNSAQDHSGRNRVRVTGEPIACRFNLALPMCPKVRTQKNTVILFGRPQKCDILTCECRTSGRLFCLSTCRREIVRGLHRTRCLQPQDRSSAALYKPKLGTASQAGRWAHPRHWGLGDFDVTHEPDVRPRPRFASGHEHARHLSDGRSRRSARRGGPDARRRGGRHLRPRRRRGGVRWRRPAVAGPTENLHRRLLRHQPTRPPATWP